MSITITSLVDTRTAANCQPEFGLSLLIEANGKTLLLDTGADEALLPNARALGIDLDNLDAIILSHSHYDHTGGLAKLSPKCPVYTVKGITAPCFSWHANSNGHWITMPQTAQDVLASTDNHEITAFTEISPGIFLTGPIPRFSGENCGGHFYTDEFRTIPNTVPEEQALLLEDGVLITGCCHAGLINTIEVCRKMRPDITIRAIVGGLHLLHADENRLQTTATYLQSLPLERLILMHCTGEAAGDYLQQHLSCHVSWGMAGQKEVIFK